MRAYLDAEEVRLRGQIYVPALKSRDGHQLTMLC